MSESIGTTPLQNRPTIGQTAEGLKEAAAAKARELGAGAQPASDGAASDVITSLLNEVNLDDAKTKLDALWVDGEKYVRANPGKAVLTAVGVGFLLGLIVRK